MEKKQFKNKDININNFNEFHKAIRKFKNDVVIYRGEKENDNLLIPKIGREKLKHSSGVGREKEILRNFKLRALSHLDSRPLTDWEWLAIAQHHGLLTRFLDWSRNPLAAAFFAVEEEHDGDSVIYVYKNKFFIEVEKRRPDPFADKAPGKYTPPHISSRINAQESVFTIHPKIKNDFRSDKRIHRLIIKNEFRKEFKEILNKYGVHRASLFPGLDGLSDHMEWSELESVH